MGINIDEFLELVLRSRLLEFSQLHEILDRAPEAAYESPSRMADWLVSGKHLTQFQANNLLEETWRGLVVDRYELREFLGRGGMGNVYLALDRKNRRSYALKILLPEQRGKTRSVLRFRREMEVGRRLEHKGIAVSYEAGIWKRIHYLVMEYVPGPTLYRLIKRQGPAHPYWAATWISEVATALDYAHQTGVVHRDMKPSNVIIMPDNHAKLLDLGLARWFDDDHNEDRVVGERRIVGSFDYIAPEQAVNSARADARSDIYGMGCLLYFTLCGKPPFHHVASSTDKIAHHKEVEPEPIESIRPDVPANLSWIVGKMMAKDRTVRYQVAAEVRDALVRWCTLYTVNSPKPAPFPDHAPEGGAEDEIASTDDPMVLGDQADSGSSSDRAAATAGDGRGFWGRMGKGLSRWFVKEESRD